MRKALILLAITCVLCGLAFAGGKGAVKADMVVHTDSATDTDNGDGSAGLPAGTVVGSVNLNTNAAGMLIVVVNLDDAVQLLDDPETEVVEDTLYDSRIWINGDDDETNDDDVYVDVVDCLKVNAQGQGTANCKIDLGALPEGTIAEDAAELKVSVVVRPYFLPKGQTQTGKPCYVNGPAWKTNILVPLK